MLAAYCLLLTSGSSTGTLACRRLRHLNLGACGLHGVIPPSLAQCMALQLLDLYSNSLDGSIPEWLGGLQKLRILNLYNNKLSGPIPPSLAECGGGKLERLNLCDNLLSGEVPAAAVARHLTLKSLWLGTRPEEDRRMRPASLITYLEARGVWYPDGGNPKLSITAAGQEMIMGAVQSGCEFWWPRVVG